MSELINQESFQKVMGEVSNKSSRYTSCIRINGSPILPPLIDGRNRDEITHFKKLAILVEEKIKNKKKIKDNCKNMDNCMTVGVLDNSSWPDPSKNKQNLHINQTFDCRKNESNCVACCMHESNSLDNASPNNLICDHDMWRYLTHCDEQFSTAWFDNQNEEFLSNFDSEVLSNSGHPNLLGDNAILNNSQLVSRLEFDAKEEKTDKMEKSLDKVSDAVSRLRIFYAEYHKDLHELNSLAGNVSPICEYEKKDCNIFNSSNCTHINQRSESNCSDVSPQLSTESNFLKDDENNETVRDCVEDAMLRINETVLHDEMETAHEHYFANLQEISDRFSDLDYSLKTTDSKDNFPKENNFPLIQCNKDNAKKEPDSSFESSLYETRIIGQECASIEGGKNCNDVYVSPLKSNTSNKLSSIKISCSSVSLPEYPASQTVKSPDKQKYEKPYNPICYSGCTSDDADNNNADVCNANYSVSHLQKEWPCNNMVNTVSDDSREDPCKYSVNRETPYFENSENQKHAVDLPLSESVSVSEIDFQSSSVATVAPDTSEETSEITKHFSDNKDNELTPPKLVRQNSYTLIAPSPILLAHAKANEKHEEKASSEDDNSRNQASYISTRQVHSNGIESNSKKGVKYIYAVPCKHTHIPVQNVKNIPVAKTKENCLLKKEQTASLPGTTVSSPVKVNSFHNSLDSLPIMTVRRFQEFIDNKCTQPTCKTSILKENQITSENKTLGNRSSSLDLQKLNQNTISNKLKDRSKSDLQELKSKQTPELNSSQESSKNNVEILFRETSFDPSSSNVSHQLAINNQLSPRSNQGIQTSYDKICQGKFRSSIQEHVKESEIEPMCNSLALDDSTVQHIFLQLQNQHSQLMAQLLDRQKKEQEALANTFLNQQRQILLEMRLIPSLPIDAQSPSAISDNDTCNLEKSSTSQETQTLGSLSEGSHLSNHIEKSLSCGNSDHNRYVNTTNTFSSTRHCNTTSEFNMVSPLPGLKNIKPMVTKEQINAATAINAAARGYLVRRLLKTEYVQEIINTISESVQCALQLQRECPIDITPSDVELHRRLIQQLTAACYSLHDTFFVLSTQEKMNIISNDREKRRYPTSRPTSARSSLSAATQKYIQRKQQQNRQTEHPMPNSRRSWWRNKARACSAGEAPSWLPQQYPAWPYDQTPSNYSKQHIVVASKQQQCNNRTVRRPWR